MFNSFNLDPGYFQPQTKLQRVRMPIAAMVLFSGGTWDGQHVVILDTAVVCKSTAISPHALVEGLIEEFTQIRCHHIRSSQMHDQGFFGYFWNY